MFNPTIGTFFVHLTDVIGTNHITTLTIKNSIFKVILEAFPFVCIWIRISFVPHLQGFIKLKAV